MGRANVSDWLTGDTLTALTAPSWPSGCQEWRTKPPPHVLATRGYKVSFTEYTHGTVTEEVKRYRERDEQDTFPWCQNTGTFNDPWGLRSLTEPLSGPPGSHTMVINKSDLLSGMPRASHHTTLDT